MTHLEFRARLAALTTEHRAKVAALHAEYNNPATRAEANAAKAAHAREARRNHALEQGAQEFLQLFEAHPEMWRDGVWNGTGTAKELAEAKRACELAPDLYAYRQTDKDHYQVTQIVTK